MLTQDIAKALSARLEGDGAIEVTRLVHPNAAQGPSDLALALSAEAAAALERTKAHAAVVSAKRPVPAGLRAVIVTDQLRTALATLTSLFDRGPDRAAGVHPTAVVASDAVLGEGVSVGPYVVIGARSRIGGQTVILPHVSVGADVLVGDGGLIHSGVRIGDRVQIGRRVIIHHNASIGADGFSFAPELGPRMPYPPELALQRVHSLGTVIIGDDVEIGASTTIDRATLEATRIGNGTKIDNQVQVGHNVRIGENCLICGKVGISGSVVIGDRVRIGGGAGIADHAEIGTEAMIGAGSGVQGRVADGLYVFGYPAKPFATALERLRYLGRQKALHQKVGELQARLDALEQSGKA